MPVIASAEAPSPSASTHQAPGVASAPTAGMIEVALGGAVVRVSPGADAEWLPKILRAVKALT